MAIVALSSARRADAGKGVARKLRAAGRVPVQRDTLYSELRRWE